MAVEPFLTKTCLYTLTPDRDFVVDALPGTRTSTSCSGSAHAYKFASVLGRIMAELAVDGSSPSEPELEAFRIDRPVLREDRTRDALPHLTPATRTRAARGVRPAVRTEPDGSCGCGGGCATVRAPADTSARPAVSRGRTGGRVEDTRRRTRCPSLGARAPSGASPRSPLPWASWSPRRIPAAAAEPLILRVGTDQKLETLNPWHSVTVADYEIFQLQYDLLVGFGQNLEPVPGLRGELVVVAPTP